ncbi:carbohydrate kinase family protein [Specibacter sp. NPDC078692]|uniref:carbohydrate kinase family protein n=1 Tax=Specibacter sp. NPDC078692 TaxID=3155818 RepID=UPI00341D43E8
MGNTNLDIIVADTRELPAPGTETVVPGISIRLGGSAGNLAVRCAGLELTTRLVSRVGDDSSLLILEAELDRPRLESHLLRTAGTVSGMTVAVEAPGQDRAFLSSLGPMAAMSPSDVAEQMLESSFLALAGYFLLPGLQGHALLELFQRAKAAGAQTVLDTGWPPQGWTDETRTEVLLTMDEVDIFLPNDDELHGLAGHTNTERAARELAVSTDTLVVVKMGARGAGVATPLGEWFECPAAPVPVIDSTGAGDGFNAAFLVSLERGAAMAHALAAAVEYATKMVSTIPEERADVPLRRIPAAAVQL